MKKITLILILIATFGTQSFAHCPIPQWCPKADLHQTLCPGDTIETIEFPSAIAKTLVITWWMNETRTNFRPTPPPGITVSGTSTPTPLGDREYAWPVSIKGTPTAPGTHHYTVSNTCGVELLHGSITLNASIPNTPGAITFSPTSVCVGDTFTASISAVNGADFYTWTTPASMTADGSDSTTLTVTNAGTTTGSLAVSVTATNSCGTSAARTQNITVGTPPTIGMVTPDTDQGTGQLTPFASTLTISPAPTGTPTPTVQWFSNTTGLPSGGTNLGSANGAQTNTFTPPVTTINATTGVYYYAVATNSCRTATTSNTSGKHLVARIGCNFVKAGGNFVTITSASFVSTQERTIPAANGKAQQTWSDAVTSPECIPRGDSYNGGTSPNFNVDCRAAINGFNGHYFSWCAVMTYANILCPGNWRVPTVQDFIDLDILFGGTGVRHLVTNNATSNGWTGTSTTERYTGTFPGTWSGARWTGWVPEGPTSSASVYWSSTENGNYAHYLAYEQTYVDPQHIYTKELGLALRCVR